jgi:DNA-binding response OmpR family regulator
MFSLIVAGLLHRQFSLTIAHDRSALAAWLDDEEPVLLVSDAALFDETVMMGLRTHRATHDAMPHVLLFASLREIQAMRSWSQSCVDKVLLKPTRSEEIMSAVIDNDCQMMNMM